MVATIIAFPGIVTSNVVHAPGEIKGTGADELRRQLTAPPVKEDKPGEKAGEEKAPEDSASDLERQLRGGK